LGTIFRISFDLSLPTAEFFAIREKRDSLASRDFHQQDVKWPQVARRGGPTETVKLRFPVSATSQAGKNAREFAVFGQTERLLLAAPIARAAKYYRQDPNDADNSQQTQNAVNQQHQERNSQRFPFGFRCSGQ
jgi:hypothetical protein